MDLKHTFGWVPEQRRRRRVQLLLLFGSLVVLLLGIGWGILYIFQDRWLLAALHLSLASLSIPVLSLVWKHKLRTATIVLAHGLLFMVILLCMLDVPVGDIPRSTHMYFLPIAAGLFFILEKDKLYLRIFIPFLYAVAFLVFASTDVGFLDPDLTAPMDVRAPGVWINNVTAVISLFVVLALMQADFAARHALEREMRKSLARGDFRLYYQPQIDNSGNVIGVEALLRWQHPQQGMISPQTFIGLAEETGLILPLGEWVIKTACAQLVAWADNPAVAHLTMSVNISASQFRQPDFVQLVTEIVRRSAVRPAKLKLELTEGVLVRDIDGVANRMHALRRLGISWSIDDFGTGFSSLNVLKRLPFDQIKIDQTFVRDVLRDERDQGIVRAVIDLGRSLGMTLIAEGVETEEQREWLGACGCEAYQGYLFSKPVPADDLVAWISSRSERLELRPVHAAG